MRPAVGCSVMCNADGLIARVIRDDLHADHQLSAGSSIFDLIDESSRGKGRRLFAELRAKEVAYDWELNVHVAGRTVTLHFSGAALDDGFLLIAHGDSQSELLDESILTMNSELVSLQRELTRQNRELQLLNEERNELLGMAAHDLRNPLGVVMAYSKFILTGMVGEVSEQQVEFLTSINASSHFMLRMVEDLLDISVIESGSLRLDLAQVDLRPLIAGNVALNAVIAEQKGVHLELEDDGGDAVVTADALKIEQVLNNLISNAVKFSRSATTVIVRVSANSAGCSVEVRDRGPGIPDSELNRLFHPFSRTSVQSTGGEKSTGLGLAIVQRIVNGHGGKVWVESQVGVGTSLHVWLPCAGPAGAPERTAGALSSRATV